MDIENDTIEDAIFAAVSEREDDPTEAATPPKPDAVEPDDQDGDNVVEQEAEQADARKPGGDLSVALRRERERNKEIQAELAREREDRARLMRMLETNQPQPKKPEEEKPEDKPNFWQDPSAYLEQQLQERLTPYEQQLAETREFYSRRAALANHDETIVTEAEQAFQKAFETGQITRDQVLALRQSIDPYAEIIQWHQNRPEAQETAMRTRLEAEILAKYGITPEHAPASPQTAAAPVAVPTLPSLNRANGNSGSQQTAAISEEDIFNATPEFGKKRKP